MLYGDEMCDAGGSKRARTSVHAPASTRASSFGPALHEPHAYGISMYVSVVRICMHVLISLISSAFNGGPNQLLSILS